MEFIKIKGFDVGPLTPPDAFYPNGGIWITKNTGEKEGEGILAHLDDFENLIAGFYEETF